MSDVLEAEIVHSGGFKTGWIDVGEKDTFRYIWCFFFYLGFILPFGFMSYWTHTIAIGELDMNKYLVASMWMVASIPFFLRPIWAQPVERLQALPLGKRRSWMLFGSLGHAILFIPLGFIDIGEQPWLFIGVIVLCMIPRLFAEQAVAGMMAESVPKLGQFNSIINFAWRGGGTILILLMGWFVAAGTESPFYKDGSLDYAAVQLTTVIIGFVAALCGIGITLLMKEGKALRGPNSKKKERFAKTLQSAIDDDSLQFPENASTGQKILAAMRTKTAWLVLLCCFLLPLGDGFEAWFINYQKEVMGFSAAKITFWSNIFIISKFLGVIGPWLSDHYGRSKMLRLYALGSISCYLGLAGAMAFGAPEIAILILWMPTLFLTDWMMFTFITIWAEVSDPRLGPTHMSLYQTTHAISGTFIMVGLGGLLLYASGDSYPLLFAAAALGPVLGLNLFTKFKLEEEVRGTDIIDITERVENIQAKLAATPWGVEPVDNSSRRRLAIATGIVGILLTAVLFGGSKFLFDWDEENTTENWTLGDWNQTIIFVEFAQTTGGAPVTATFEVPSSEGGVLFGNFMVLYEGDNSAGTSNVEWKVEFTMPSRGNFSDGGNASSWSNEANWQSLMDISFDAQQPNLTGYESEEDLLQALDSISREMWWGHSRGTWTLKVTPTDLGLLPGNQATFRLIMSATHLVKPSTVLQDGFVNVSTTTSEVSHTYGQAIGVLIGFPVLLATPFLVWVATQDPEKILD
ncbi:MAG: hypothetical protein QF440_05845 [Candidatus Thalassarchaeaceae archaeon]|jgi:hypothetical protein|nr:hypothetical protein [Candidatus Thalassarchaeaceae archaeon]